MDGQRLVKLRWGSKAEVVGAKGLRMGITLSSQGALEKATLLIDACNGLTKGRGGPGPVLWQGFGGEGRGDNYAGGEGISLSKVGSSLLPRNASGGTIRITKCWSAEYRKIGGNSLARLSANSIIT